MKTIIENIPQELKNLKQWVCWVGSDKIPKNAYTGGYAKSNDSTTWSTFEEAIKGCKKYRFDGLGFMFANGYFGVDLDNCLNNIDFCDEFVESLQSYTEFSKSGKGIHIICKGELPEGARRKDNVEMYSTGRYFICTGKIYNEKYKTINECTESIKVLHSKYMPKIVQQVASYDEVEPLNLSDEEIIDKARNCKSGYLFNMLYLGNWQGVYNSQSEADLALCNQLAFWTQRNQQQMDRIFRSSGLFRKKWVEKRGDRTYGEITINKACISCKDVYELKKYNDSDLALKLFKDGTVGVDTTNGKQYDMTDTGNAHRLYDKFHKIIRYSYIQKKWYFWTGKVWKVDTSGEIKKLADVVCEDIKRDAFLEVDEKTQANMFKWASRTASSRGKEAMIKECQHLGEIPVNPEDFDSYTDYLNCQNGIINLRNGELLKHDSEFMLTKICNCDYDISKKKPLKWMKFLQDITKSNPELMEYLQKCVGYSLTGSIKEQCAYFLYGIGNNGKSTFLDTLSDLIGNYGANTQPETIMMKKWKSDGANSDIARLKSARFVTTEEPTEGVRLNEGLLKQLTGGSKVTCRFLYGEEFEYNPEFKIWVATNHKPIIRGTDLGIWRRIKLIPFEVTIPKEKVDKNLKYKLRQEFPQILKWAVDGCIKWQKEGIEAPACVDSAIKEYKQEMDLLSEFIDQCIEIDYNNEERIMGSDLFKLYSRWSKENNEFEMTSRKFFKEMTKKMPTKGKNNKGVYFKNIRITDYGQDLSDIFKQYNFSDFN